MKPNDIPLGVNGYNQRNEGGVLLTASRLKQKNV